MKRRSMISVGLVALLGSAAIYVASAVAQTSPLQVIPLAQGFSPEHQLKLHAQGPSNVLVAKMTLDPLGEVGWHTHAGPVILVVTQGTLTQYHTNGCVSTHPPQSVIVEEKGEIHKIVNHSGSVIAEGYATFILPPNTPPLVPVAEPPLKACNPGQQKQH
jgi:quercetin dioxygenase-like cupin family protein